MADWQINIRNLDNTVRINNIPIRDFTCSWVLNSPGAFEATLDLNNVNTTRLNLEPGQRVVRVVRDGVLCWEGYLWGVNAELRDTVKIRAEGVTSRLRRRYVMSDLIYTDVAQETILRNLIAHTQAQANGDLGISTSIGGNHTGGSIVRDRDYCAMQHPNIGSEVDAFCELDDGLDYFITPTIGFSSSKTVKTYQPRRGTDLSGSVTIDQTKISKLSYELTADGVVSRLVSIGQDDCNPPEDDRSDATALTNFGLLQQFDSVDSAQLRDVKAHGAETLRNLKQAQRLSLAEIHEGKITWGAFDVGDVISLSSNRGPAGGFGNFTETARVLGIEVFAEPPKIAFYRVLLDSVTT